MPAAPESFSLGLPVGLGEIERELKKLWASGESAMTRASLINLAVYSEEAGSLACNTQLVARLTEDQACRAIVIAIDPNAQGAEVEAWISAHCHVRDGARQVCSEQISFLLPGHSKQLLPSIVFSQLDGDLPLTLWWQASFVAPMDPQLWTWVDRLIYDSQRWQKFEEQMNLVETARKEGNQRMILCDLNWTRLLHFRLAFAQFFDHPASHHHFATIEQATIGYGSAYRSTALLFAGWLAAQLRWDLEDEAEESIHFKNANGRSVRVTLQAGGEAPLHSFVAQSGELEFRVALARCGDLLKVSRGACGKATAHQLLPAGDNDPVKLVSEELMRGGPRRIYLRAIEKVRSVLG